MPKEIIAALIVAGASFIASCVAVYAAVRARKNTLDGVSHKDQLDQKNQKSNGIKQLVARAESLRVALWEITFQFEFITNYNLDDGEQFFERAQSKLATALDQFNETWTTVKSELNPNDEETKLIRWYRHQAWDRLRAIHQDVGQFKQLYSNPASHASQKVRDLLEFLESSRQILDSFVLHLAMLSKA